MRAVLTPRSWPHSLGEGIRIGWCPCSTIGNNHTKNHSRHPFLHFPRRMLWDVMLLDAVGDWMLSSESKMRALHG